MSIVQVLEDSAILRTFLQKSYSVNHRGNLSDSRRHGYRRYRLNHYNLNLYIEDKIKGMSVLAGAQRSNALLRAHDRGAPHLRAWPRRCQTARACGSYRVSNRSDGVG